MAKILYVEDDSDLSGLLVRWLSTKKHTAQLVTSGLEALECLEFEQYDLVLLDCNLPDVDGLEICKQFRSNNGITPIILLTGSSGSEIAESGMKAGANVVLHKPPDLAKLSASINSLLPEIQ